MSLAKPTVDQSTAQQILREAIAVAQDPSEPISTTEWDAKIKTIIRGSHLTYRYILVTALLAKATNPNINALTLQAGAAVEGAYDARSLCHGVVVPLERQLLDRSLGGSNEPFLNKPARFPTISRSNAVRAGKDRALLNILYQVISEIETSEQAFQSLCIAVQSALQRQTDGSVAFLTQPTASADSHLKVIEFIDAVITRSIEGQVAVLVAGTILSTHFDQFEGFEVVIHPTNQSGASSKEVSDIDIKQNGKIFLAIEVKDKQFSQQDVDHAAFKVSQYGLKVITFIIGVNGICIGSSLEQVSKTILVTRNVNVMFVDLASFIRSIIALCPDLSFAKFLAKLQYHAINARVKDDFFEHVKRALQSMEKELGI